LSYLPAQMDLLIKFLGTDESLGIGFAALYGDLSPGIGKSIAENKRILPEVEEQLRQALDAFTSTWQ